MKPFLFYPRLAFDGMRKNSRLYLPYILTCIGIVTVEYILSFLSKSDAIYALRGGEIILTILSLGTLVLGVFSCLFLFYTNSFLTRRRKKEFGLYNMLGMGKKNIALILFWETLLTALISIIAGLGFGILLSKLSELGLLYVMKSDVNYDFSISLESVKSTVITYLVIFLLIFLNSLRQVHFSTAVNLLKSENTGEKPPKGNIFYGLLGIVCLAIAYYIAITVENPLAAVTLFFIAVILVIFGTYLLMIAGSVLFCRLLQKNKKFYYRPNHFVSVSSMVYRMKRNGAGLASICILATMVLVMASSTSSLYFGVEDTLDDMYPRDVNISIDILPEHFTEEKEYELDEVRELIKDYTSENGGELGNTVDYRYVYTAGVLNGDTINIDYTTADIKNVMSLDGLYEVFFVKLSDYNKIKNTQIELSDGEALLYISRVSNYKFENIRFVNGKSFKVTNIPEFTIPGAAMASIVPSIFLIVPDVNSAVSGIDYLADFNGDRMIHHRWYYCFDTGLPKEQHHDFAYKLIDMLDEKSEAVLGIKLTMNSIETREYERAYTYSMNGGFFFLGIMLSIVFLLSTVLIMYYKQLSEGYEDQSRFEIMQKVGMTKKEIRKSVNSQLLTVFFLPLIFAAVHIVFAFPIIKRILSVFNLSNTLPFLIATVISFLVFTLFYVIVYKITSNAYYKIVSGGSQRRELKSLGEM